jgi:AcrR family transcriptional regulator
MQRDRSQTERRLIEAVGVLIAEEGADSLGINRIARRSGVNKVLIYRYFGGLDGLVQAYHQRSQTESVNPDTMPVLVGQDSSPDSFETFYPTLIEAFRHLRTDTEAQALLRAELLGHDPGQDAQRTKMYNWQVATEMTSELANIIGGSIGPAYAALIINGLMMLSIQQNLDSTSSEQPEEARWQEIETAVWFIFRATALSMTARQRVSR